MRRRLVRVVLDTLVLFGIFLNIVHATEDFATEPGMQLDGFVYLLYGLVLLVVVFCVVFLWDLKGSKKSGSFDEKKETFDISKEYIEELDVWEVSIVGEGGVDSARVVVNGEPRHTFNPVEKGDSVRLDVSKEDNISIRKNR